MDLFSPFNIVMYVMLFLVLIGFFFVTFWLARARIAVYKCTRHPSEMDSSESSTAELGEVDDSRTSTSGSFDSPDPGTTSQLESDVSGSESASDR